MEKELYKGIPNLRPAGVATNFTIEQTKEYIKCQQNFEYFLENYIYIKDIDSPTGLTLFKLRDYQKEMLSTIDNNKYVIIRYPRQSGKSTTVAAYVVWKILFEDKYNVIIAANKSAAAIEIMERVKDAYINLPYWLQMGIVSWNVFGLMLENGSKVQASSTTKDTGRGGTKNLVLADEFAFVDQRIADSFTASILPSISSGENSKFIIVSTPNGMNHFYKLWTEAIEGLNDFVPLEIKWTDVPGRDEKFKKQMIGALGKAKWEQEFEMVFTGGDNTLISPEILSAVPFIKPIEVKDNLRIYEKPIEGHEYVLCADTSHGKSQDYSAFIVFDISVNPYNIVAIYQNNTISEMVYPTFIYQTAKFYNNSLVLCETNDLGKSVANTLYNTLEYENMIMTEQNGKRGQVISYKNKSEPGLRMTSSSKRTGCSVLKSLIENNQLKINDFEFIKELTNFVASGNSYAAKTGTNDDLVMCGVIFSWLIEQEDFQSNHNFNLREKLYEKQIKQAEEEFIPFGFSDDGGNSLDIENIRLF